VISTYRLQQLLQQYAHFAVLGLVSPSISTLAPLEISSLR
jgi:hypothetical protein